MNVTARAARIRELARIRTPAARGELLLALVDLHDSPATAEPDQLAEVQQALGELLLQLAREVERDIRRRLSEKLAAADWPPPALINLLALDEIEVASPVIAASPLLNDSDLVRIMISATVAHQVAVASRPLIGPSVVEAALDANAPEVLTALAGNETAKIGSQAMERLVESAETIPSLRTPLSRHPALQPHHAQRLYQWVGASLRQALRERFRLDDAQAETAFTQAADEAFAAAHGSDAPRRQAAPDPEREEMDRRLLDKLHGAAQLKPGYLLRALREGKLSLFEGALAKLGGYSHAQVRHATNALSPELLALACAGVGLDRSVFPTILSLVRELNEGRPFGHGQSGLTAVEALGDHPPARIAEAFRRAVAV